MTEKEKDKEIARLREERDDSRFWTWLWFVMFLVTA